MPDPMPTPDEMLGAEDFITAEGGTPIGATPVTAADIAHAMKGFQPRSGDHLLVHENFLTLAQAERHFDRRFHVEQRKRPWLGWIIDRIRYSLLLALARQLDASGRRWEQGGLGDVHAGESPERLHPVVVFDETEAEWALRLKKRLLATPANPNAGLPVFSSPHIKPGEAYLVDPKAMKL